MNYAINMIVLLHHSADKYLGRLSASDQERINAALDDLEKEPPEGDIATITGEPGRFIDLAEDYWKPAIEPASPEEAAMIDERVKEYERNPSSFVPRRKSV